MAPLSYWHDSLAPDDAGPRPPLPGDTQVDVAIVGAGFTGTWTGYYLRRLDPTLRVVVIDRELVGFGASGRNGGWCVGDQSAPLPSVEKAAGATAVTALLDAVHDSVDEVGRVVEREAIDCGYHKGGALILASNRRQLRRLHHKTRELAQYGHEDAFRRLDPRETTAVVNAAGIHGSVFTPHAAAVHPARLVRGVARAFERIGGVVHEDTAALAIEPGRVQTVHGEIRADVVVRATEAYSSSLPGHQHDLVAIGNYVVATEPIPDDVWAEIGLADRELFEDGAIMLGYGQRTADGRIVWGGRAGPTYWGAHLPGSPMTSTRVTERLRTALVTRFPVLDGVRFTHQWGGVLGVSRDFWPSLGVDRSSGLAWAGGYFGAGVAAANLAGRTLAELIVGVESERVQLPWVDHRSRQWEPEPLRWLGTHAAAVGAHVSDAFDRLVG